MKNREITALMNEIGKMDLEKRRYEVHFLTEFLEITNFTQATALKVSRLYVETILILWNDGYSPKDTAKYVCSLIDVDEILKYQ